MAKGEEKNKEGFGDLAQLMARLRGEGGCPWDREQTHESLTPYIVEEAYELLEAIGDGDPKHVCEELGDLLFQIIFQAQIADEHGEFDIDDVIAGIHEKMTRRHPHVFGDAHADTPEQVKKNWVRIKEAEGKIEKKSALGRVARSLPSLLRGRRITENAAEVGFDWRATQEVMEKFEEEVNELKEIMADGDSAEVDEEFGDVLFALVNLSRFLSINPDQALNRAIAKFERRFYYIEQMVAESGRTMENVSLEEMEKYWEEAKGKGM